MASAVLLKYSYVSQGFFNFPFLVISRGGGGGGGGRQHAGDFLTYNFKQHWGGRGGMGGWFMQAHLQSFLTHSFTVLAA